MASHVSHIIIAVAVYGCAMLVGCNSPLLHIASWTWMADCSDEEQLGIISQLDYEIMIQMLQDTCYFC